MKENLLQGREEFSLNFNEKPPKDEPKLAAMRRASLSPETAGVTREKVTAFRRTSLAPVSPFAIPSPAASRRGSVADDGKRVVMAPSELAAIEEMTTRVKERLLRERVAAATALEALERRQQTLQLTTLRLFDYIKGTRVAARGQGGRVDMTKVLSPAWPAFLAAPFRTWHALAAESLRLLGQARRFLGRHVLRRVRAVLHAWSRAARAEKGALERSVLLWGRYISRKTLAKAAAALRAWRAAAERAAGLARAVAVGDVRRGESAGRRALEAWRAELRRRAGVAWVLARAFRLTAANARRDAFTHWRGGVAAAGRLRALAQRARFREKREAFGAWGRAAQRRRGLRVLHARLRRKADAARRARAFLAWSARADRCALLRLREGQWQAAGELRRVAGAFRAWEESVEVIRGMEGARAEAGQREARHAAERAEWAGQKEEFLAVLDAEKHKYQLLEKRQEEEYRTRLAGHVQREAESRQMLETKVKEFAFVLDEKDVHHEQALQELREAHAAEVAALRGERADMEAAFGAKVEGLQSQHLAAETRVRDDYEARLSMSLDKEKSYLKEIQTARKYKEAERQEKEAAKREAAALAQQLKQLKLAVIGLEGKLAQKDSSIAAVSGMVDRLHAEKQSAAQAAAETLNNHRAVMVKKMARRLGKSVAVKALGTWADSVRFLKFVKEKLALSTQGLLLFALRRWRGRAALAAGLRRTVSRWTLNRLHGAFARWGKALLLRKMTGTRAGRLAGLKYLKHLSSGSGVALAAHRHSIIKQEVLLKAYTAWATFRSYRAQLVSVEDPGHRAWMALLLKAWGARAASSGVLAPASQVLQLRRHRAILCGWRRVGQLRKARAVKEERLSFYVRQALVARTFGLWRQYLMLALQFRGKEGATIQRWMRRVLHSVLRSWYGLVLRKKEQTVAAQKSLSRWQAQQALACFLYWGEIARHWRWRRSRLHQAVCRLRNRQLLKGLEAWQAFVVDEREHRARARVQHQLDGYKGRLEDTQVRLSTAEFRKSEAENCMSDLISAVSSLNWKLRNTEEPPADRGAGLAAQARRTFHAAMPTFGTPPVAANRFVSPYYRRSMTPVSGGVYEEWRTDDHVEDLA